MPFLASTSSTAVVVAFAVVFGLVLLVPWTIDLVFAEIKRGTGQVPRLTPGLSRASMAIGVLTVVGFALMYLLVAPPTGIGNVGPLIRDIVIALTTTLAAVVAFYFGTKAAERPVGDQPAAANPEKLPSDEVIREVARHSWTDDERARLSKAAAKL